MANPVVTVYCLAFNHEKYIRQCLESLVGQKTTFPYTIIVHEDASEDNTKQIIAEFAEKYPDIIFPIYQVVNQYQKRVPIVRKFIEPRIHSEYVAICEGDDYWSSQDKLQRQYDFMEEHPECGMCVHRTKEVTEHCRETGIEYPKQVYSTGVLDEHDFFDSFEFRIFHTSSFFMRADYWHEYINNPPSYRVGAVVGDDPLLLYFGSQYPVFQINEVLSCYRRGAASSWSSSKFNVDESWLLRYFTSMEKLYVEFDKATNFKFHSYVVKRSSKYLYGRCVLSEDFRDYFKEEVRDCITQYSILKKLTVCLGFFFPQLIKYIYLQHLRNKSQKENKRWKG